MFLTRWKMMAGLLAVSLGGLAAMAGQCTKTDPAKGPPPPEMPTASAPATKPAAAPMMTPPATPSLPPIPSAELAKGGVVPPVLPVIQTGGVVPPAGGPVSPSIPPVETAPAPAVEKPDLPTLPQPGTPAPTPPAVAPPASHAAAPPMSIPADPLLADAPPPAPVTFVKPAAAVTAAAQAKYRILLRVGEGEPVFEVRSGDHLILKVVCDKVDVKSPENGQGLSAVKAAGKVRFAGFGAEGTCDELHFLAGTGEVGMTGNVKIQVKDKLGRVESELSADTMRYRIDPHTTTGNGLLKP